MSHDIHHEHLIKELSTQLDPLFASSPQGIYLYLDDVHKICNKKFADMLGYSSIQEWIDNEYPVEDIAEEDRDRVIEAYVNASQKLIASTHQVACISKSGKKLNAEVIMVPIPYKNETFVLHYISKLK